MGHASSKRDLHQDSEALRVPKLAEDFVCPRRHLP